MRPKLPRILLWTDLSVESDFPVPTVAMELRRLYEECFCSNQKTFLHPVKILNEVFYQCTKVCFEDVTNPKISDYVYHIEKNLGHHKYVDVVLGLMYILLSMSHNDSMAVLEFRYLLDRHKIFMMNIGSIFYKLMNNRNHCIKDGVLLRPNPIPVEELSAMNLDWSLITCDFDDEAVQTVIDLWDQPAEKAYINVVLRNDYEKHHPNKTHSILKSRYDCVEKPTDSWEPDTMINAPFEDRVGIMSAINNKAAAIMIISTLHQLMEGKTKPKDVIMPIRAAIEAGAMRRPSWEEFCSEFGDKRVKSKSSLIVYTDPRENKYEGETFDLMVDKFRKMVK